MKRTLLVMVALVVGLTAACTGDKPTASPPTAGWEPGDIRGDLPPCEVISGQVLELLQVTRDRFDDSCHYEGAGEGRSLDLRYRRAEPKVLDSGARLLTASEVADTRFGDGFVRTNGVSQSSAVSGLGSRAMLRRTLDLAYGSVQVGLTVRVRNVNIDLTARAINQTVGPRVEIPALTAVDSALVAAATDVLTGLDSPVRLAAAKPAEPGELPKAPSVCAAVAGAAAALVPGRELADFAPFGSAYAHSCEWSDPDGPAVLTVRVEVLPPTPGTDRSGPTVVDALCTQAPGPTVEPAGTSIGSRIVYGRSAETRTAVACHTNALVTVRRSNGPQTHGDPIDRRLAELARTVLQQLGAR